ncbi:MAG: sulfatase-like hydrolase/transferase, partial [Acidimicrobiia bacterium]
MTAAPRSFAAASARRSGSWSREARAALELFALTGVAVAQPTLDIVSKDATGVFVTRDATAMQIVGFAAIVVLLPTIVLWTVEVILGAIIARRAVHACLCAGLIGIITIEVVKQAASFSPALVLAIAVAVGTGGGFCVWHFHLVRLWLRYLAVAPFIVVALFIFSSPVTPVVFGRSPEAASGVRIGSPARVVMVVLDEFPVESLLDGNGHVDAALFPNFAALERGSTWYRNNTTVSPSTESAVPALLTGDYVTNELATPVASQYPENLFTLLGGAYRMNVHEPFTRLCPKSLCAGTKAEPGSGGGISGMLEDAASVWRKYASPEPTPTVQPVLRTALSSDESLETVRKFVESLRPASAAQLDFVHVLLPHSPWQFLGDGQNYGPERRPTVPGILTPELRWRDEFAATSMRQRHLLQVQVADALLGRIVDKLRRIGAYDESLLIVTADHGATFTAGQQLRGLSQTAYPEVMWTPLFVKASDAREGTIDDTSVRSIDVLPTIADHLDITLPWQTDGRSALSERRSEGRLRISSTIWDEEPPPAGSDFHEFDGAAGFARVLRARAGDGGASDGLQLYRTGPFGRLVGTPAAPRLEAGATAVAATFA